MLDILGVDHEQIVADYLITAERMPLIVGRYRSDPALADRMATVPASRFSVEAATMQRFLTGLHDQFGGARAWATTAGVPASALDRMASVLLEPPRLRSCTIPPTSSPGPGPRLGDVTASIWVPIIAGVLVFFALLAAGVVASGYLVWRYGRRKWRAFHSHGAVVAATAMWGATASGRLRPRSPLTSNTAGEWPARRVRRELWRAVDQADAAVRAAAGVGAPTASLPALCARLREAAIGLDQVLRVEPAATVPPAVAAQAIDVVRAAGDLQRAAVASASRRHRPSAQWADPGCRPGDRAARRRPGLGSGRPAPAAPLSRTTIPVPRPRRPQAAPAGQPAASTSSTAPHSTSSPSASRVVVDGQRRQEADHVADSCRT